MTATLEELNAQILTPVYSSGRYDLATEYAVGSQSRRGRQSPKTHLLRVERVIADREPKPGTYRVGDTFSVAAICNGNGQHTGRIYRGQDTDSITCQKCLSSLAGRG